MRHTRWIPALIVVATAIAMSQAAAGECLSAPKGTAAKGQHWYYHLDRTTHQKCWYLRDAAAAAPAAPEAASHAQQSADSASTAPTAATTPREPTTPAAPAASSIASSADTAAPPEPSAPQNTGNIWSDPPAPSAAPETPVPPAGAAPAPTISESQSTPAQQFATPDQPAQAPAAEPKASPASSLAENLWIAALAASLAAFTFAGFALVRSRRANAVRSAPAAPAGPRFGSGGVRRSNTRWPTEATGETPALPAIEASLIPEQVSMPLPPLDTRR